MGEKAVTERNQQAGPEAEAGPDPRARAAAYLDLWERHVVLLALEGPAAGATSGAAPGAARAPRRWPG